MYNAYVVFCFVCLRLMFCVPNVSSFSGCTFSVFFSVYLKILKGQSESANRRRTDKTKDKRTNNVPQNTAKKTKDRGTRPPTKYRGVRVDSSVPERFCAVPAPLMAPVVLKYKQSN